jgi:hypothetical protein
VAILYAITWGAMLAIGLVYFFSIPDAFIATVFLLFRHRRSRRRAERESLNSVRTKRRDKPA